jgi:RNA polymerase sigma-70 factor (ECF subfamily)
MGRLSVTRPIETGTITYRVPAKKNTATTATPSETDVAMERYAAGEDAAFALVYDTLAPRILGYLLRRTNDWQDAEDLLQQTMLQLHRSRGAFIAGAEVTPWAFAIARHLLVDRFRRREPGRRVDDRKLETRASEAPPADELLHARELADCVERAVAELPDSQRTVLALIKEDGLSFAEAAKVLGTTVGAAKARTSRAYQAIRAELARASASLRRGTR